MELLNLQVTAAVFATFIILIALLNNRSKKYSKTRHMDRKKKIYACGEDISPNRMNVPQDSFYTVMIRSLGLEKLREWHNGDLSRYLTWVFTGMVIIMLYLLLLWGVYI